MNAIMESAGWTVPGLLVARHAQTPEAIALWQLASNGKWLASRWADYRDAVAALAGAFCRLGLVAGERVGIMASSCKEWDYAQLGILAAGGVAVGLDAHGLDAHVQEISQRCQFVGLVVERPALLQKLGESARRKLRFVVSIEPCDEPGCVDLATLLGLASDNTHWNRAQPDATATIIFTSGTTGAPKGIAYSHRQMCLAAASILSAFPDIAAGSRLACWLPLSNLFQRMINLCAVACAAQTYYVADPREIMQHVASIEPHVFIGVPRFYEKLYSGINEALAKKPLWQQALVRWAWRIGESAAQAQRSAKPGGRLLQLQLALAERLVLRNLRGILGSQLRFMISGSAPMPLWLLERFHAIGLLVLEAYGLSENIIPVALNRPDRFRFGSVGQALPGCEVRLADDGELLVRGPGVFAGYFNEDALTKTVDDAGHSAGGETSDARIDADGFLKSGDFARIDSDGFITLTGRKAEIFKTSTGRRVAPAAIESLLRQLPQTEFAAVFGAGRAQPTALLVVGEAAWQEGHEAFAERWRDAARRALAPLPPYLQPAALAMTTRPFSIAGGELTANLKMRRRQIEVNFAAVLGELGAHIDHAAGVSFAEPGADGTTFYMSL